MTTNLSGYDAWKLASPPDGMPRCGRCSEAYEDHYPVGGTMMCVEPQYYYEAEPPERDPDRERDDR